MKLFAHAMLGLFVGALFAAGCSKPTAPASAPSDGVAPTPDDTATADATAPADAPAGTPELARYAGWESWAKINEARFVSKGHGRAWVDVFVDPQYVDVYKAGQTAPVGMRVVKAQYRDEAGSKFSKLTTMEKVAPGYDAEHGDWYYGVYEQDGTSERNGGTIGYCRRCHHKASDRDYLFGTP